MNLNKYLVVIDTTESTRSRSLQRGIINTYIVSAVDENVARQIVLRTMNPNFASQISDSLYVYNLDSIEYALENAENSNGRILPMFSFMPLNGGRPQRMLNLPQRPKGAIAPQPPVEKKVEEQPAVKQQVPFVAPQLMNPREIRSNSFRQEPATPQTSDAVNNEQSQILQSLGVFPAKFGSDEGANPRINSDVGANLNQTNVQKPPESRNALSREQLELSQKIGVNNSIPENTVIEDDIGGVPVEDPSLMQVDGDLLSETQILALQQEFKQVATELNVNIKDSVP